MRKAAKFEKASIFGLTYSCGRFFNAVILGAKLRESMLFLLLMLCGIAILVQRFMEQGNAAAIGSTKTI